MPQSPSPQCGIVYSTTYAVHSGCACYTKMPQSPIPQCGIVVFLVFIITPRAHARARGYVIGRGVYIYIVVYYIL